MRIDFDVRDNVKDSDRWQDFAILNVSKPFSSESIKEEWINNSWSRSVQLVLNPPAGLALLDSNYWLNESLT